MSDDGDPTRYRAAFERAFDAMVVADDAGEYVDVNRSAAELFGLPREALVGRRIDEFAPDDFDFEAAWASFRASDDERGTFPLVRADGERRTVEYAATREITPGEHLSVMRDVTEREERVEELRREQERFQEFASVVSHDLRNPLMTAQGFLELAREDGDPSHFERAELSLDRMERIIDDVLWLAREGPDIGETEPVELQGAVERAWSIVAGDDQEDDLDLADLGPATITADPDRLSRLLENLLGNAVRHGGPGAHVAVRATDDGFAVDDDGPGLPEHDQQEVFEWGYTTSDGGTGFGLAIAEQIAEAHGWTLRGTESDLGGARFAVAGVEFDEP